MLCPYCGKENVDMSPFCSQCGKSLAEMSSHPEVNSEGKNTSENVSSEQVAAADSSDHAVSQNSVSGQMPPEYPNAPYPSGPACPPPTPPDASQVQFHAGEPPRPNMPNVPNPNQNRVLYAKSCMGAAWDDIVHTEGWIGKILLLGLINIVPILNFVVSGYAMKWARELPMGEVQPMPKKIFDGTFVIGFYAFVIALVAGIVSSVACGILDIVPLLGPLVGIAVSLFLAIFCYMAYMRVGLSERIGSGFDIPQIWDSLKKDFGSLFCATIVPELIVGAIAVVIVLIIMLVFALPAVGQLMASISGSGVHHGYYYDYGAPYYSNNLWTVLSVFAAFLPALFLSYIVLCFVSAFETVWIMRAVGHYVARYTPEWKELADSQRHYYQV